MAPFHAFLSPSAGLRHSQRRDQACLIALLRPVIPWSISVD